MRQGHCDLLYILADGPQAAVGIQDGFQGCHGSMNSGRMRSLARYAEIEFKGSRFQFIRVREKVWWSVIA